MLVLRATPGPPRPGFCAKVSTSTKHKCSVGEPAEGSLPNLFVSRLGTGRAGPHGLPAPPHASPQQPSLTTTCKCVGTNARQGVLTGSTSTGWRCCASPRSVQMTWEKTPTKTTTITSFFNETLRNLPVRKCFVTVIKLLAMDILAIATMKNAAKCDT